MIKRLVCAIMAILFYSQAAFSDGVSPDSTDEARQFIEDLGRRAIASLTKVSVPQSQLESSFKSLLEEGFDVSSIAQFVMGRYWNRMTPHQQNRFIPIFENRLIKSYANRFQEYRGVDFKIKDAHQDADFVIVQSTIQKTGGPLTPVDWRVKNGKIHDIKVEGVSMSITIRDEYNALIQSNSGNIEQFLQTLSGGAVGE